MEDKEVHPVVELLLARMKSHPEEFQDPYMLTELKPVNGYERWDPALRAVMSTGNDTDKEAIEEGLRPIRMKQIHEWVMDELCNGEERRRKKQEDDQYYERMMLQQQAQIQSAFLQRYTNQHQSLQTLGSYYEVPPTTTGTGLVETIKKGLGIK